MSWVEERDQLIAETLAFVQGISGSQPELASKIRAAVTVESEAAKNSALIVPCEPLQIADLRKDVGDRVATFKARQQHLQDERENYFRKTLDEACATLRS